MELLKPRPPLPNPFEKDPFRRFPCGSIAMLTLGSVLAAGGILSRVMRRR